MDINKYKCSNCGNKLKYGDTIKYDPDTDMFRATTDPICPNCFYITQ